MKKKQPTWEMLYNIVPDTGVIDPGQLMWVEISFTPNKTDSFTQKLALKIRDNPTKKIITVKGVGENLSFDLSDEVAASLEAE